MQLQLRNELAFVTVSITSRGVRVEIPDVLIDTGAASTVINVDIAGVHVEPGDRLKTLRGVGGSEVVFARHVDRFELDTFGIEQFEVEFGAMDYGFQMGGIIGMDFLRVAGAAIDLRNLTIELATSVTN